MPMPKKERRPVVHHLMMAEEYRAAIEALSLTQGEAGEFLGVNPRTSRRWALGETPVEPAAAKLLRLMVNSNISPAQVDAEQMAIIRKAEAA